MVGLPKSMLISDHTFLYTVYYHVQPFNFLYISVPFWSLQYEETLFLFKWVINCEFWWNCSLFLKAFGSNQNFRVSRRKKYKLNVLSQFENLNVNRNGKCMRTKIIQIHQQEDNVAAYHWIQLLNFSSSEYQIPTIHVYNSA